MDVAKDSDQRVMKGRKKRKGEAGKQLHLHIWILERKGGRGRRQ
jgi:hypothetical protein